MDSLSLGAGLPLGQDTSYTTMRNTAVASRVQQRRGLSPNNSVDLLVVSQRHAGDQRDQLFHVDLRRRRGVRHHRLHGDRVPSARQLCHQLRSVTAAAAAAAVCNNETCNNNGIKFG